MPITLLASACPPVPTPAGFSSNSISISSASSARTSFVSEGLGPSEPSPWTAKLRRDAARADLLARSGAGWYAVADGLALTAGTGLLPAISAGHAIIDGPVEYAGGTVAVPDNSVRVWIWLLRTGLLFAATALALPGGPAVLIGSVTTVAGVVTAVDTSGVMQLLGGNAWRVTADTGKPADTPPATTSFYAQTAGGLWIWNGATYLPVKVPALVNDGNSGAALTVDLSAANTQKITLTASAALTLISANPGTLYYLLLTQDATGSRLVTWPASVKWSGGAAPTLTTTAGKTDIIGLIFDGTNYFGSVLGLNY
jgi:hypothetical protein